MAWVSGVFSRLHNWVNDRDANIKILATRHDAEDDNLAAGINNTLTKDGQNTATANLPMGNFRHTGVGNASTRTDYASAAQIQDSELVAVTDTGAANAYAIAPSPAITAYVIFNLFWFKATNANTGASTINVNALGVKNLLKQHDVELDADDIVANGLYGAMYDGTNFQLISPITATSVDRLHISGLIGTNGTDADHDIDFSVGEAADSTNDQLMKNNAVKTKQIDVNWVAGTNAGGFPSGLTLTASTVYHRFMIKDVTGGLTDFGWDTSLTAVNLLLDATDYTLFRRVGSDITDASLNIEDFEDPVELAGGAVDIEWDAVANDISSGATTVQTVTTKVPIGFSVLGKYSCRLQANSSGGAATAAVSSGLRTAGRTAGALGAAGNTLTANSGFVAGVNPNDQSDILVATNTSGQLFTDVNQVTGVGISFNLWTRGYIDLRIN